MVVKYGNWMSCPAESRAMNSGAMSKTAKITSNHHDSNNNSKNTQTYGINSRPCP